MPQVRSQASTEAPTNPSRNSQTNRNDRLAPRFCAGIKTSSISGRVRYGGTRLRRRAGHHQRKADRDDPLVRLGESTRRESAPAPVYFDRPAIGAGLLICRQDGPATRANRGRRLGDGSSPSAISPGGANGNALSVDGPAGDRPAVYRHWHSKLSAPSRSKTPTPAMLPGPHRLNLRQRPKAGQCGPAS